MVVGLKKWGVFLFIISILLSSSVLADFRVDISPDTQTVTFNQTAEFRLTIIHNLDQEYLFEIYSPDVEWDIATKPTSDRLLKAKPGVAKSTILQVRPLYVKSGYYAVPINIKRSGTNDLVKTNAFMSVQSPEEHVQEYSPAVNTEVTLPEKIDPRNEVLIQIKLKNQNRRNLDKVDVKIRSDLINKDYTTSLRPLETKELEFKARLDPTSQPRDDFLKITIFATAGDDTVQFDVNPIKYRILPVGKIDIREEIEKGILGKTKRITLRNEGNIKKTFEYEEKASFLRRLFIKAEPGAIVKEKNGVGYLYWNIPLEPNEEVVLTIKTNYNMLFLMILLGILLIGGYFKLRSPLLITKAAMIVSTKQGGVSELKVIISIKNRTKQPLDNVLIHDKVPSIATVEKNFDMGTLKPEKIIHHEHGETIMKWTIPTVDGFGERLLSYRIKTKLSVLGSLELPPAQAKFKHYSRDRITLSKVENLFGR